LVHAWVAHAMPAPPKRLPEAPTPEAFQEKLAYLVAAYEQVHAERETLRQLQLGSCAKPDVTAALHFNSQLANGNHDEPLEHPEMDEPGMEPSVDDDQVYDGPPRTVLQSWLPSKRNLGSTVTRSTSKVQSHLMDQYFRLANAHVCGLTAHDLLVVGLRFNLALDEQALFWALVRFRDFCEPGPDCVQHDRQMLRSQEDIHEAARGLGIPFSVFERLAGQEELGSLQVLQDDSESLLILRGALTQEASRHTAACEENWHNTLESVGGCAILLSVLVLGIHINRPYDPRDIDNQFPWVPIFEAVFLLWFSLELLLKIRRRGMQWVFFGPIWYWHMFDLACAVTGIVTMLIVVARRVGVASETFGGRYAILARVVRLARVARLFRLLRFRCLGELRAMVEGVVAGCRVLFWAIVMLLVFIYVLALFVMVVLQHSEQERDISEEAQIYLDQQSFGTVFWSMFTLFRCFTGDCSAFDGTPLHLHISKFYGYPFMVLYVLFYLFVTIGMFNLVTATYLDNAIDFSNKRRQREREENAGEMEGRLRQLICDLSQRERPRPRKSGIRRRLARLFSWCRPQSRKRMCERSVIDPTLTINKQCFDTWLEDAQMLDLLDDMDIGTANRADLFHVLDSDMSGSLQLNELIEGLMKLRGPAEKCDVVATLLAVKHLTPMIEDMYAYSTSGKRLEAAVAEGTAKLD